MPPITIISPPIKAPSFCISEPPKNPDVALDLSLDQYISAEGKYTLGPVFDHDRFTERKNLHFRRIVDNNSFFIDRGNRLALAIEVFAQSK